MVIFERQGQQGASLNTPPDCDVWQYYEGRANFGQTWDTVRDARQAYTILRGNLARQLWTRLWNGFNCPPPGKQCNIKQACENNPVFIEGGADLVQDPDGNLRWRVYMILGRQIKCTNTGNGSDVTPNIPDYVPFAMAPSSGSHFTLLINNRVEDVELPLTSAIGSSMEAGGGKLGKGG
jgi:hypothetical protein